MVHLALPDAETLFSYSREQELLDNRSVSVVSLVDNGQGRGRDELRDSLRHMAESAAGVATGSRTPAPL